MIGALRHSDPIFFPTDPHLPSVSFAQSPYPSYPCGDLSTYCGGTFRGIIDNLDYIQDLGFNAIWISPVVTNAEGGYHGYW